MPATMMNHFTVLTDDVDGTIRFYGDMLDLEPGPRPPFDFPGAWLYAHGGNEAILHVIGGRPRDELRSGVIDHMAFTSVGLADTLAKLEARGMPYRAGDWLASARGSSSSTTSTARASRWISTRRSRSATLAA